MSYQRFFLVVLMFLLSSADVFAGRGRSIEVELRDYYTYRVIPNAQIICTKTEDTLFTDAEGKCVFEKCKGKKFTFIINHPDFKEIKERVNFEKRSGSEVNFSLMPNAGSFDAYTEVLWEKGMQERMSLDSTKFLPCDQDSTPDRFNSEFPGGMRMFHKYINENLLYPEESIDMEEQGKVYLSFVIEKDGSISNIKVERGVSTLLDREAKRLIQEMPKWIPAYCNGRPETTRVRIPLTFTMY